MAKAYPKEFRDDVVAVARRGQAPLSQIATPFGKEALQALGGPSGPRVHVVGARTTPRATIRPKEMRDPPLVKPSCSRSRTKPPDQR